MRSLGDVRASRLADRRFAMTATVTFSTLALGLSVLGLYGVLAHLVQQRTKEIGIRMALGASAVRLRCSVLSSGARHAVAGVVGGIVCGLGLWKLVAAQVPGLGHIDAEIVAVISGILLVVALAATWIPARRATRVNPVDALRAE
jgi:ABC-type antimicrobial peptide transport system permease subunit